MRSLFLLVAIGGICLLAASTPARAAASIPALSAPLEKLMARHAALISEIESAKTQEDIDAVRQPMQDLVFDYEGYLRDRPDDPWGFVAYARLLGHPVLGEQRRMVGLLLRANELDANIPLVKNQLGKYVAEDGKPLDALNYFLAAVDLAPEEPLYHFQVGNLLMVARDDFLKSGEWTEAQIDQTMQDALLRARTLAPQDWRFGYAYGLSFYAISQPDWPKALAFWEEYAQQCQPGIEQQTCLLHRARVEFEQQHFATARELLAGVEESVLQKQKQDLGARLDAAAATLETTG